VDNGPEIRQLLTGLPETPPAEQPDERRQLVWDMLEELCFVNMGEGLFPESSEEE